MLRIRRISVHVDEPDPGHFYWVLMEEGDDASEWRGLASANEGCDMWLDALQAGTKALLGYAPDERIGPREVGDDDDDDDDDDEDAPPVGIPMR